MAINFASKPRRPPSAYVLSPCGVLGTRGPCSRPRLKGERTCFDHLDVDELERAIAEPDEDDDVVVSIEIRSEPEEASAPAVTAARQEEVASVPAAKNVKKPASMRLDPPFVCGCGQLTTDWPPSKAKHQLKCAGVPIARSGRIAARSGTRAIAVVRAKPVVRRKRARIASNGHRTPPAAAVVAIAAAATDKATEIVIAGLMAKRELIDRAIAALQAVAS